MNSSTPNSTKKQLLNTKYKKSCKKNKIYVTHFLPSNQNQVQLPSSQPTPGATVKHYAQDVCCSFVDLFFFHTHFIIMNYPLNMATDSENSLKVSSTLIIHIQQVTSIQKRMTGSKEKIQNRTVWLVVLYVYSKVVRSKQDHNSIDLIY